MGTDKNVNRVNGLWIVRVLAVLSNRRQAGYKRFFHTLVRRCADIGKGAVQLNIWEKFFFAMLSRL